MKRCMSLALAGSLLLAAAAQAATFTVTKTADSADGACDADCSLREAVIAANASPGADEVALGAGTYALTLGFATFCPVVCDPDCTVCDWEVQDETTGDLDVTGDLTIRGAGADATVIDQQFQDRVLRLTSGAVVLEDLTVSGGERGGYTKSAFGISGTVSGQGGGVLVEAGASLDLRRVEVRGNYVRAGGSCQHGICAISGGEGGGILARGPLTADASSIVENSVENGNSFFGLDSPAKGAGLSLRAASSFVNTTIAGNVRAGSWGTYPPRQVHVRGAAASFDSCTLVAAGGGTALETGEPAAPPPGTTTDPATAVELRNTVLGVAGCTADAAGQVVSLDYNLDQDGSCGLGGAADLSGVDPLLGPLQDLGGPTRVQPILAGSPAIDTGDGAACPAADQVGTARPQDGDGNGSWLCDRGAYEAPTPPCGVMRGAAKRPASSLALYGLAAGALLFPRRRRRASAWSDSLRKDRACPALLVEGAGKEGRPCVESRTRP